MARCVGCGVQDAATPICAACGFAAPALWKAEHGEGYKVPRTVEALGRDGMLQDEAWHNDV